MLGLGLGLCVRVRVRVMCSGFVSRQPVVPARRLVFLGCYFFNLIDYFLTCLVFCLRAGQVHTCVIRVSASSKVLLAPPPPSIPGKGFRCPPPLCVVGVVVVVVW